MFCDVFNKKQALNLIEGKKILFIGSSNMRAIYKDLLWLVTHGSLAPMASFKVKNEPSYLNDKRISNDTLHNGRNYKETREIKSDKYQLMFHFITRLYLDHFVELINSIDSTNCPDVILINSCLWDLTRWGPDGPKNFKANILRTMKFLKNKLPAKTRVIWKTTLPVSMSADGAIFVDEIKFIVPMLPWHILEANFYASTCANFFNYDTIDFHHHLRLQGHLRVKDGVHWQPNAVRYLTNLFLTHLCLSWDRKLPGHFKPDSKYLTETTKVTIHQVKLQERVNKKDGFFKKLFEKTEKAVKNNHHLQGIKNKVLSVTKNVFKPKRQNKQKLKSAVSNTVNNFNHNANQPILPQNRWNTHNSVTNNYGYNNYMNQVNSWATNGQFYQNYNYQNTIANSLVQLNNYQQQIFHNFNQNHENNYYSQFKW